MQTQMQIMASGFFSSPSGLLCYKADFITGDQMGEEIKKVGDITLVPQPSDSPNDPLNWLVLSAQSMREWHR